MKSNRTFYKTVIKIEILSETPYHQTDLAQIASDIDEGDQVGEVTAEINNEELDGKQAADSLIRLGSEPAFFMLDKQGNDVHDDEEDFDDNEEPYIRKMKE